MNKKISKEKNDRLPLIARILIGIFLVFIIVMMGLPMLNVLAVSLSTPAKSDAPGMVLFPSPLSLEGYSFIWKNAKLQLPFFNTVFVATVGTILHILMSSLAGYVLVEKHLPFRKTMTSFVLVTMAIPVELTLIGIYAVNKQLGLINTYTGLIVNGLVSGFSVLLMRNYFLTIPEALAESARLEGASEFLIFRSIFLRLSVPGMVTIGTLEFIRRWNNISLTITLISDMKKWTLPVVLRWLLFDQDHTSGAVYIFANAKMAAVVISAIPLILLYYFAQDTLNAGVKAGSIKG